MAGNENLVLNIHSAELIEPLAEFRETVREMFDGREGADCGDYTGTVGAPKLHAEFPVGGTYIAPFVVHGAKVSAAIVGDEFEVTQAQDDLVSVQTYLENITGPGRNEGEMRYRYFQLQYSRQDRLGNVALWRVHKQTFQSEHGSGGPGHSKSESAREVRQPLQQPAEIRQYLRGAAHLISVFLDPDKHPKTQLLR